MVMDDAARERIEAEALAAFRVDVSYSIEMARDARIAAERDERMRAKRERELERGRIRREAARAARAAAQS
ncbi:hypothetical protein [Microbacterium sp.]|uniref:hypothetical protein n=1 Tax=Microbacterium sp. TaxID=51671 RepID=UPI003F9E5E0A